MGKSMKSRALIGIAAFALLLSVLVGVVASVGATGGQMTVADSITWCRSCI